MRYRRMAAVASDAADAQAALTALAARYPLAEPDRADVIVALGGDGFMLETQHRFLHQGKPIYGMSRGTVAS
ncbi:NAD kinase [Geodia barretti]|uniref:NAD kinase n=1 Tax=Geodia barretti TaxID=519541 RepID=A0AA35U0K1_GEOBA|nr:NAD kinase [Geodia barretti]